MYDIYFFQYYIIEFIQKNIQIKNIISELRTYTF